MKKILPLLLLVLIVAGAGGYYYYVKNKPIMNAQEANQVLQTLVEGNARFVAGKPREHDYQAQILDTKKTQAPSTVVLSCMDSRSIPELAFDKGIGSVFTLRVAGNVINQDILGSMEYATKVVGAKLIVVMGHTNCGAIKAACKDAKLGNLTDLLQDIRPAVKTVESNVQNAECTDKTFVDQIAKQNVLNMIHAIPVQSPIIAELLKNNEVKIVGAMYDVSTGKVSFFEDTKE